MEEELQFKAYFNKRGHLGLTTTIESGSWPIWHHEALKTSTYRWVAKSANWEILHALVDAKGSSQIMERKYPSDGSRWHPLLVC